MHHSFWTWFSLILNGVNILKWLVSGIILYQLPLIIVVRLNSPVLAKWIVTLSACIVRPNGRLKRSGHCHIWWCAYQFVWNIARYEAFRQDHIKKKIEQERQSRISVIKKLPKINAKEAMRILSRQKQVQGQRQEEAESGADGSIVRANKKSFVANPLSDPRFKAMFEDEDFVVDTRSKEYMALHPNEGGKVVRHPNSGAVLTHEANPILSFSCLSYSIQKATGMFLHPDLLASASATLIYFSSCRMCWMQFNLDITMCPYIGSVPQQRLIPGNQWVAHEGVVAPQPLRFLYKKWTGP